MKSATKHRRFHQQLLAKGLLELFSRIRSKARSARLFRPRVNALLHRLRVLQPLMEGLVASQRPWKCGVACTQLSILHDAVEPCEEFMERAALFPSLPEAWAKLLVGGSLSEDLQKATRSIDFWLEIISVDDFNLPWSTSHQCRSRPESQGQRLGRKRRQEEELSRAVQEVADYFQKEAQGVDPGPLPPALVQLLREGIDAAWAAEAAPAPAALEAPHVDGQSGCNVEATAGAGSDVEPAARGRAGQQAFSPSWDLPKLNLKPLKLDLSSEPRAKQLDAAAETEAHATWRPGIRSRTYGQPAGGRLGAVDHSDVSVREVHHEAGRRQPCHIEGPRMALQREGISEWRSREQLAAARDCKGCGIAEGAVSGVAAETDIVDTQDEALEEAPLLVSWECLGHADLEDRWQLQRQPADRDHLAVQANGTQIGLQQCPQGEQPKPAGLRGQQAAAAAAVLAVVNEKLADLAAGAGEQGDVNQEEPKDSRCIEAPSKEFPGPQPDDRLLARATAKILAAEVRLPTVVVRRRAQRRREACLMRGIGGSSPCGGEKHSALEWDGTIGSEVSKLRWTERKPRPLDSALGLEEDTDVPLAEFHKAERLSPWAA